jgi:glutathionylspermidine synthase
VTTTEAYDVFARRIVSSGIITDPWIHGEPRFDPAPVILSSREAGELARAAAALGEAYDEGVRLVGDDLSLLDDFFGLTPIQKAMFAASYPLWHGIARADLFFTEDGIQTTELNCDTPTGEAEALVLGEIARAETPELVDPNASLERRFGRMLGALVEALVGEDAPRRAGIVYPTEFTEDLSLVRLYRRWLEAAGYEVTLGSPYNLRAAGDGTACLFDEPVSLLVRHYKTDWWSERASAWRTEELLDTAPLAEPLEIALRAHAESKTVVVNPFGAVLPQNKKMMAFMWEHIHRFSIRAQDTIRALVPVTHRLEALHPELLRAKREEWVMKSDYGAEGDEVVVGRLATDEEWRASLEQARPGRWVAQRYFEARRDPKGRATNLGVFLVAGQAAGLYARLHEGATDDAALSAPVLIDPGR